jgi:hypothetical protein
MSMLQLPRLRSLASVQPSQSQVSISVPNFGASWLSVAYKTLPGNTPKTNSNFLAIWESTVIPWPIPPLAKQPVIGDTQDGSVTFSNLTIQSKAYIVGYAVGPDITDICATAVIYVGGQTGGPSDQFSTSIGIVSVLSDTVVVQYTCCPGYQPQAAKNWVGIWQGNTVPYYAGNPLYQQAVTSTSTQGAVVMNGLTLAISTQYTLAYFVGPDVTDAAAILTFTTSGP